MAENIYKMSIFFLFSEFHDKTGEPVKIREETHQIGRFGMSAYVVSFQFEA